eukprot:SAG31_NODE_2235_length_6123_cov_2.723274_6_plen_81_part_00
MAERTKAVAAASDANSGNSSTLVRPSNDDVVDVLISLDEVTAQRDELQVQRRTLLQALALFLPAADLGTQLHSSPVRTNI